MHGNWIPCFCNPGILDIFVSHKKSLQTPNRPLDPLLHLRRTEDHHPHISVRWDDAKSRRWAIGPQHIKQHPKNPRKRPRSGGGLPVGVFVSRKVGGVGLEKKDGSELNDVKITNYTICDKIFFSINAEKNKFKSKKNVWKVTFENLKQREGHKLECQNTTRTTKTWRD